MDSFPQGPEKIYHNLHWHQGGFPFHSKIPGPRGAKDLLLHMVERGGDPSALAEEFDLFQTSDSGELKDAVKKVLADNESAVQEYKKGKMGALQFLVGQAMRATKGKGNPETIREILQKELKQ